MATQRNSKHLSALKKSRKFRDRARQESRRLHLEQLEDRRVMAVFILPNNGVLLNNGDTRTIAPQDLTFRFTDIPGLDPTTIAGGIRLTRAGGDGVFGQANDVVIAPGFIGLGDNNSEVVMRFAATLPDDTYRIQIFGAGATPLRDTAGDPYNNGADTVLNFRLDLGAQVIAVVPQPVRRLPNGSLAMNEVDPSNPSGPARSTANMIHVYFNDDDLDPVSATTRDFYRLYTTRNTLDPSDDREVTPTAVEYDPATNMARLIFGQVSSLDQLEPFVAGSGIPDPIGSLRLRIGTSESLRNGGQATTVQQLGPDDPGSSFADARDLGSVITLGGQGATVAVAQAIEAQSYSLIWPGSIQDPGHRDIPPTRETHLLSGADTAGGIPTVYYNFKSLIGQIPDGLGGFQDAFNLITENQKQRAREIFDLYTRYSGVQFVESADSGLTVATGDMRVLDPTIPTGPGGVAGLATVGGMAIMDNGEVWDDSYGANWFRVAMHEIGHMLGSGHTYDLPPVTIQGDDPGLSFGVGAEPVFPGDNDIVHMRHMFRPESKDIDLYRFTLDGTGVLTLEAFAERLPNSSSLDTHLRLYRVGAGGVIEEIARNDDYFSNDSMIRLTLGAGTYFVGVTASGNDQYDPTIVDSGIGGTTQGTYELKLDFRKSATQSIVDRTLPTGIIPDTLNVPLDGNADGTPGGVYNFWFRAAPTNIVTGRARTIFVDKATTTPGNGLLTAPFRNIDDAMAAANEFDIVRIVGNGGADGNLATTHDNVAYQIGFGGASGSEELADGSELAVKKNVTVMIDAGAIFQLRRAQIAVGSTSPAEASDRSGGALQVLGTPTQSVFFTSYNELGGAGITTNIGRDDNPFSVPPTAGDWGGLSFRNDLDAADGRFDHEAVGVFLNYVNHADIRFGGGQVNVESVNQVVNPINLLDRRPTITFNTIRNSANAAMSANPDSFEETNFQAPRFWRTYASTPLYTPSGIASTPSTSYTLDYDRIGPDIHANRLINNSTNALFVRTRTPAGNVLEELTVAGRFNDTDIVHVLEENLVIRGTPGGPTLEQFPPPTQLILPSTLSGLGNFAAGTTVQYKLVWVDLHGNESLASTTFAHPVNAANSAVQLLQLPGVPSQFVARKLYRRTSSTQPFTFVDQIPASVDSYIDRNLPSTLSTAARLQLKVLATPATIHRPRLDAGLVIDPSIIIKSDGARLEAGIGANLIAEGFAGQEIVFTSLSDDRYGAGTTFDTNNDSPRLPAAPVIATTIQGSGTVNEQQTITLPGNPTAGQFTLTFNGQTTTPLAFNAPAAAVQAALQALTTIGTGNALVSFTNNIWTVTFTGTLARQNVAQLTGAISIGGEQAQPGDWGGIFFWADSKGSIDNAVVAYAGGLNRIEGTFAGFNPVEIHQADVRITQSKFEFNANGQGGQAPADRFSRGANAPGTIFVRGAQPVIMDNLVLENGGAFINVNVNGLNHEQVVDSGRQSGFVEREPGHFDNNGPLILRNRLRDNELNGMIVRGGTVTTESVWDDTDIVHILLDMVTIADFHVFGALRLESSATQSLVVKSSGATAGFTATGRPLEIDDRIGGILHILGQPGVPVILTGLTDDTEGAGLTPEGTLQTDTDGNGSTGGGGGGLPTGPEVNNGTLIDNDVATGTVGHFEFRPGPGGISVSSGVTAQGQTQLFVNQDYIFDFLNFVDIGASGQAIDLSTTTITQQPTLIGNDLVASEGTFQGANGLVTWRVETRIDNGTAVVNNTLILTSPQPLGALRFINYLDEDVLGFTDDLLFQSGSPGQADFRLFTLDNVERIGFAQGGTYTAGPGLVNATYEGWAADKFADLVTVIPGAGTTYTPTGNIDLTDLTPFVDPALGNVHGLADVTTAMSWVVDPAATTATITTFLELIPEAPATVGNPGEWQGVTIGEWAHDRNVETILELETGDGSTNAVPQNAQILGGLGPFEKGGDENLRLGFTIHGLLGNTGDVDVYSFSGKSGTEVWIDIDRTTHALDAIVELIDNNGNVLARSDNSPAEAAGTETLFGLSRLMQKTPPYEGRDFYTTNQRDGGMRLLLPGPANTNNSYFIRVRSAPSSLAGEFGNSVNPGLTSGAYQLQLRLREVDELGGSTVRFTKIANATIGIHVVGQPTHSPLGGEAGETDDGTNNTFGGSQFIGNLLNSDRGMLSLAGAMSAVGDIDWYSFDVTYDATQGIAGVSDGEDWWSTVFDIDYADGFARPNLTISVFDANGNLIVSSRDSNIGDDQPNPLTPASSSDLTRGSGGTADPFAGPIELPQGRYFVAVSSDNIMPQALTQFTAGASGNPLMRLEPSNSVRRLVEARIDQEGGSNVDVVESNFIDTISLETNSIVPWNLHDVTLFVSQTGPVNNSTILRTIDPFSGTVETTVGRFPVHTGDIAMHPQGRMYTFSMSTEGAGAQGFADTAVGRYFEIDTGTADVTELGDDGIATFEQDPASAQIAPVLANPINNNRVGEGIHFRALDIAVVPGTFIPGGGGYAGLALGGRGGPEAFPNANDPRNIPRNEFPNILYAFNHTNGQAVSITSPDRTGNGVLAGAGTQIVERGVLETTIDANPLGSAEILTVAEATRVPGTIAGTEFQILDFGYPVGIQEIPQNLASPTTFRVRQGFQNRLFEFDAGPEALFAIDPTVVNQQIRDGQGFSVNGQAAGTGRSARLEFDTGQVIVVAGSGTLANFPDGSTFTITDVNPDPQGAGSRAPITTTFEFSVDGTPTAPTNIVITTGDNASAVQMIQRIMDAINGRNAIDGFTTEAVRLQGTGRISLVNRAPAPGIANPLAYHNTDSTVTFAGIPATGAALSGAIGVGGDPQNIRIRIEETSVQADLHETFRFANEAQILPFNSIRGTSGPANGFNRVEAGFDGTRINFSGATSIVVGDPMLPASVFQPLGSLGGAAFPGRTVVPFLANDTADQIADRVADALTGAFYTGVSSPDGTGQVVVQNGLFISADDPLQTAAEAPGGTLTGMASINGRVWTVSDTGGLFEILNADQPGGAELDFIDTSGDLAGIEFASLSAGPRHVEGGRYQNMLFGIDTQGELYAFNTAGELQPIFRSEFNPLTGLMEARTSVPTGLTNVTGLAFSNLDYNLFHTAPNAQRGGDAGHGVNEVFDASRRAIEGRSSLYFGFESVGLNNLTSEQRYAPTQGTDNFFFPGGAHGTIETNTFSLLGYSPADQPMLYFNYFLETEGAGHNPNTPIFMRDSFRVFAAGEDGEWHLLGTNNGNRFTPNPATPPNDEIDYDADRVQETFDNTNSWRQARIPLGDFAGQDNLRLRFDFSTAGSMNVGDYTHLNGQANTPTNGDELRTIDGIYLRDGQSFTLTTPGLAGTNQTFTFDLGYTLVAPNGLSVPDGARFTIDGVNFEFDRNGTVTPGFIPVVYLASDQPAQVAQRIAAAILASPVTSPIAVNGHRINLRGGAPGAVVGALNVTAVNMPAFFIEGAPGVTGGHRVNVHAAMTRQEVREAIALVMANVYASNMDDPSTPTINEARPQIKTHDEIIRLIGYRWVGQSAGPNADPTGNTANQRPLGITLQLPGDEFGAFNASTQADGTTNNNFPGALRGQNNALEGVYIDDIIIGFAERGEMMTPLAPAQGTGFVPNPKSDDDNVQTGAYQLEIRRGAETGIPSFTTALPRLILLPQIDTNDRLAPGRTLIAPDGSQIAEGQFFSLSDGINTVVFEFNDLAIQSAAVPDTIAVTQGRIRINFNTRDSANLIAQAVRNAINSAPVQAVLKIAAQLDDGATAGSSTNRVNLIGAVSVPNAGTVPGAGVIAPPTGPETNNGTLIDNDVPTSIVGHFEIQPGPGGNVGHLNPFDLPVGRSGVSVQGVTQQFVNLDFIFDYLNYIDLGTSGEAFNLGNTNITQAPTRISNDLVQSRGNFLGPNGPIDWVVDTRINNASLVVENTISFSSPQSLGPMRLINYLDEDVFGVGDDFLFQTGAPGQADFRLYTLDNTERVGFSQGGVYTRGPGLVNASYDGWAADAFSQLRDAITSPLGASFSVLGNLDANDLQPRIDPKLGAVHGLADVTTAMSWSVDPSATTATITTLLELLPLDPPGNLNFIAFTEQYGDRNQFRDQGQIILQGNEISNSEEWGIFIDAARGNAADGDKPHPGAARNLRELHTERLVPGVVVMNNVIHNNGAGGIRFSGDPSIIDGVVPFGRIVNNTLFGTGGSLTGGAALDVGIQVDQNAAPTLMNNILANFDQGINVDASSQGPTPSRTVLGGNVYQGNGKNPAAPNNANINLANDSTNIFLTSNDPLFVNPEGRNFYLAAGSRAIDSAVDSLLDRPSLVTVKNPLGIAQSPILSPDRDGLGQLKVDDPSVNWPLGVGLNPFKDRGAIDRVDFVGPTSLLTTPPDNDLEGTDLDPAPTTVVRTNDIIRDFRIQLIDRFDVNSPPEGSNIDDLTVTAATVVVEVMSGPNQGVMQQGTDYSFAYDATNNTIILTPRGGLWPLGQTYRITLDNSVTGIHDQAGNTLLPNQADGSSHYYTIFVGSAIDFGDAPDTYGTLLASNGPSHLVNPAIRLGPSIGAEADGQPSADASADLSDDGVSNFVLVPSGAVNASSVTVLASFATTGVLDGWIDTNQNGLFDASEHYLAGRSLTQNGTPETISFTLPTGPRGTTMARFRITSTGIADPTGPALDGEVEDYQVTLTGPQFQNGTLAPDVNNSGVVNTLDLLIVVNFFTTLFQSVIIDGNPPTPHPLRLPPTAADYNEPVPTFDPTGGGVPGQGRFVDVDGSGILSPLDIVAVVNYITANFTPGGAGGEGEGPAAALAAESDRAEGEGASLLATGLAAASQPTLVGVAQSVTGDNSRLEAASLLAAPNIILEVRELGGGSQPGSDLASDWTSDEDDDLLSLVAASASTQWSKPGLALAESRREVKMGPLVDDSWDDLLGELALDVGGLPGDGEDQI